MIIKKKKAHKNGIKAMSRRKIFIWSAISMSLMTILVFALVFHFTKFTEGEDPDKGELGTITYSYNYVPIAENDLRFTLDPTTNTATLVGFQGAPNMGAAFGTLGNTPALNTANDEEYALVIPEVLSNGYKVTAIDIPTSSFPGMKSNYPTWWVTGGQVQGFDHILKVVVPKSVETISVGAFNTFKNVCYMELPFVGTTRGNRNTNAATGWHSSFHAIFGDQKFMSMQDYDINGIRTVIPADITATSGSGQTPWYNKLSTNGVPDNYLNVPEHLQEVYITDEYHIADHAFFLSPFLKKLSIKWSDTIPSDQVGGAGFGAHVFDTDIALETVILPSNISSYGEGLFNQCVKLNTVAVGGQETGESGDYRVLNTNLPAEGQVHLPLESMPAADINSNTFYGCRSIINMVIPHTVKRIMDHAFDGCTQMSNVHSSDPTDTGSVDTSESGPKLNSCVLPRGIEYIGTLAFRNCESLQIIVVQSAVKTIESMAFNHCVGLKSITLPFIGREAGNGNYNNANYGEDIHNRHEELLEAMFGYIFGMYGETGAGNASDNTDLLVFQAVDGNPATARSVTSTGAMDQTSRGYYYIPSGLTEVTITNESVVAVGAFMNCKSIESLTITSFEEDQNGYSTTKIGKGALGGCVNLKNLSIPFVGPNDRQLTKGQVKNGGGAINYQLGYIFGSNSLYGTAGMSLVAQTRALGGTEDYYLPPKLEKVELTHQTYVPSHTFYRVSSIKDVVIGNKTKGIQRGIFTGNTNLTSLEVPFAGVGRGVYYNGGGIYYEHDHWYGDYWYGYDYDIRNSLIWLFTNQTGNEMYYNDYVTSWQGRWDCFIPEAFKNVKITDDNHLGTFAFRGFSSLENIEIQAGPSCDINTMTIDEKSMYGCGSVKSLILPFVGRDRNTNSVNSRAYTIGWLFGQTSYANSYGVVQGVSDAVTYYIPKGLETIQFGDAMTCIANGAFRGMTSLDSVYSEANIQQLGSYAFDGCTNLNHVDIKNASYSYMGNYAFQNCRSLTRISEFSPETVTRIGHGALKGTSIGNVDLKKYYFLGDYAFSDCLQLTSIDFTDAATNCVDPYHRKLEYVGKHLFDACTFLTDVTLQNYITDGHTVTQYVSDYMFANCTSLRTLQLNNKVRTIPEGFLMNCTNLESYHIDNSLGTAKDAGLILDPTNSGVTSIGAYAFKNCRSLETFQLPETINNIGNGAFQDCIGLNSMRIPRSKPIIPLGTDANGDNYVKGVFYGCDERKFYLEVFYPEAQWAPTWGNNWNCYFPVFIIGDQSENIFTYEYCSDLRGYIINGLNLYDAANNPEGVTFITADNRLSYDGTLIFPTTHNGLIVYGLKENCFNDYYVQAIVDGNTSATSVHPFHNIENFVLGSNFITIGENAFNFENAASRRYRNIFSQKTSSQAKVALGKNCGCQNADHPDSHNSYSGLHYDDEAVYAVHSIVYYKEAWTFVPGTTTPVFSLAAVDFILDSSAYQYALGKKIEPRITEVMVNHDIVKYPDGADEYSEFDQLYQLFYPDGDDLDLSSVKLQFSNNVNVGTGKLHIAAAAAALSGSKDINFVISPKQIDVFYESGKHANTYGTSNGLVADPDGTNALTANDHFENLIMYAGTTVNPSWNNSTNFPNFRQPAVETYEYSGDNWTNSSWSVGINVFGLPQAYLFTGVIATNSPNVGYYWANSDVVPSIYAGIGLDDKLHPGEKINYIDGFKWTTQPKILDDRGNDVTRNFKVAVTLALYIKPFEITEVQWPGTKASDGVYEYEYTGAAIVPVPTVKNAAGKVLNPQFVVKVANGPAIIPSSTIFTAQVENYDRRNFRYNVYSTGPINEYNYINFRVIPAKLKITMNVVEYLIGENQLEFSFSDFKNWSNYTEPYNLKITGLGLNSYVSGRIYTTSSTPEAGWSNQTYIYDATGSSTYQIVWDIANYFKVYIDDGDGDPTNDFDATSYYTPTFDLAVKIEWNRFNYNYLITTPNMPDHVITGPNKGMGIKSYADTASKTQIIYGTDGYAHTIKIQFNNVLNPSAVNLEMDNGVDPAGSTYTFENFGVYIFNLKMKKDRFYPISKEVEIQVGKGEYTFEDLSKEYDRQRVEPISKLIRRPKDLDETKLVFAYYNRNDVKYENPLGLAPYEIGNYKFTLTTLEGHSEFFEDCNEWPRGSKDDSEADFRITPRSLIIKVVDDIAPFDSKQYDGYPWSFSAVADSSPSLNLLPGDSLTGSFMSRSADIGVYDGSNSADFVNSGAPWRVNNPTLGDQTSNYVVVFDGVYTILPRSLQWDVQGAELSYDGRYHTVTVNVTEPLYGYTIYYSERELPLDSGEWSTFPTFYTEPGTYTIYVKLEAPHYQTECKSATIIIHGKTMEWYATDENVHYDGYAHGITSVQIVEPWYAEVQYAVLPNNWTNADLENLTLTSSCPKFTEPGIYNYYVQVSATNYETEYRIVTLTIDNYGPSQNIAITGETVQYDGEYHGPIFDFSSAPTDVTPDTVEVYYYVGDNTVQNPSWIRMTLTPMDDGTGRYYIPLYVNAGNHTLTIKTLVKGYSISQVTVDVNIIARKLSLAAINYNELFDNKYHTALLQCTNPNHYLEVTSDLDANPAVLTYRYYFENTLPSDNYVDLLVRYSDKPVVGGNVSGYNSSLLSYKDVGEYDVFMYITADNCSSEFVVGEVIIRFNPDPLMEFDPNPFDVEYLARQITLGDMPFETEHDGNPIIKYYSYKKDVPTDDGIPFNTALNPNVIAAPMDLGEYHMIITYPATRNCAAKTVEVDFRIVPRKLIIEYDPQVEYTGQRVFPEVTVITNTTDVIEVRREIAPGYPEPIQIGNYEMDIWQLVPNDNYYIDINDQRLPFEIIRRNIYITLYETVAYDEGKPWTKTTNWTVENLLANDMFSADMQTRVGQAFKYGLFGSLIYDNGNYKDNLTLNGSVTTPFAFDIVINDLTILTEDPMNPGSWIDATYYKVNLEMLVSIEYPEFDVDVQDTSVWYDGADHGLDVTILSPALNYWSKFWLVSKNDYDQNLLSVDNEYAKSLVTISGDNTSVTGPGDELSSASQVNVGEYYILYAFGALGFNPKIGIAKLEIQKVLLDIHVEPYDEVYDAQAHQVDYHIDNLIATPTTPKPEYYYYDFEEVEAAGYTIIDILDFFRDGKKETTPANGKVSLVNLFNSAKTELRNHGKYYAIVYYEDSLNWGRSVGYAIAEVHKRALYFNYLPVQDLVISHYYDGNKVVIWMGDFEYDTTATSKNKDSDKGLIAGHQILCGSMAENAFCTVSPDCRGEANNPGYEEPYQKDGDFEFYKMNIRDGLNINYADNYYPVINPDPLDPDHYRVSVIIMRINLDGFEVFDYIRVYDKKDALPKTSVDENYVGVGEFIYYYYKVDDQKNYFDYNMTYPAYANATAHEKDVTEFNIGGTDVQGYYQVYITVADGRNYYGWTGADVFDSNFGVTVQNVLGTTSLVAANGSNYSFKMAYVQVVPRRVDLIWNSLDEVFDIDTNGKAKSYIPSAYFEEPDGNKIVVSDITIYNPEDGSVLMDETYPLIPATSISRAGSYPLIANYTSKNYIINDNSATFNLAKRTYKISETLSEPWLHTYWTKTYTEEYFIENPTLNELSWLPGFTARISVSTVVNKAGVYYRGNHFTTSIQVLDSNGIDYTDSFDFILDLYVNLTSNELIVESQFTDVLYDNNYHMPIIDVLSHMNGYVISYDVVMVRPDGSYYNNMRVPEDHTITYQATLPRTLVHPDTGQIHTAFRDVGRYRVFYRVVLGDGDEVDQTTIDIKTGTVDVLIEQNNSELSFANTGLNRVYNGIAPTPVELQNSIVGRYNGSSGNLNFVYYNEGDTNPLNNAPVDVGRYTLVVTSSADNNPNYIQNYTPLDASYTYEITPRTITLNVRTDWQVNDDILNNTTYRWSSNGTLPTGGTLPPNGFIYGDGISKVRNNLSSDSSRYWITAGKDVGLVTSDYLDFEVKSTSHLPRGKYYYRDGQLHDTGFNFSYVNGDFDVTWDVYYDDTILGALPKTNNYRLVLDFTLDVHFPYMTVNVQDVTVDFDGNPHTLLAPSGQNIEIVQPTSNYSILYGTTNNDITMASYQQTNPGVYRVYFKITATGYEDYENSTVLTIKFKKRDDLLEITRNLGKIYDNVPYDQNTANVSDASGYLVEVDWKDPSSLDPYEALPSHNSWEIEYFLAEQNPDGSWRRVGDAVSSVVDAGTYIYRLKIPAGMYYAETIIEKTFVIERRKYTISNPENEPVVRKTYDGLPWRYNIATNPDQFVIEGLLPNHAITVGILYSNSVTVGRYELDTTSNKRVMLEFNSGNDYILWDSLANRDVRDNYREEINVTLEIVSADMVLKWPDQTEYYYPGIGKKITPVATLIIPSSYSYKIEYSVDGVNWQSSPIGFDEIGPHQVIARVIDVPNYNNALEAYHFEIKKEDNILVVEDLTRPYNGDPIKWPEIITHGWSGAVNTRSDITVTWFEVVGGKKSSIPGNVRPINVGDYEVEIEIPDTPYYNGRCEPFSFSITPLELTIVWEDPNLVYNGQEQAPRFKLSSADYPGLEVLGSLIEGVDYTLTYYDTENDPSTPIGKPRPHGDYQVVLELTPSAAKNYSFNIENNVTKSSIYYSIAKCPVAVSFTGNFTYDGNLVNIPRNKLKVEGLPAIMDFQSGLITKSSARGDYTVSGINGGTTFTSKYQWSTGGVGGPTPTIKFTSGPLASQDDDLENYLISVNVNMKIISDSLTYNVSRYNNVYDGEFHTFDFEVIADPNDTITIEYSVDGGSTYTTTRPVYRDAAPSPRHVWVRVQSLLYGLPADNYYIYLGRNTSDTDYHEFEIEINKADTILEDKIYNLNKVYDDQPVEDPEIIYNGEDRDEYLEFKYYRWDEDNSTYVPVNESKSSRPVEVGKYKLVVNMTDSTNYYGTDPTLTKPDDKAPLEIEFEITKRRLILSMDPQTKVYDLLEWSVLADNLDPLSPVEFNAVSGVPESGLVTGHHFHGTIETMSAIVGEYNRSGLNESFTLVSGWKIIKPSDNNDVSKNYDVRFDLNVKITEAEFDITAYGVSRPYVKGVVSSIRVEFNVIPYISNGLSLDDLITYSDDPAGFDDLSKFTSINPQYESGGHTVYFMIQAPNYKTYYGVAKVEIDPLSAAVIIEDWKGKFVGDDKEYDGQPYNVDTIKISFADGSSLGDRQVTYTFFDKDGNQILGTPVNAGSYSFVVNVSADSAGIYEPCSSKPVSFVITKQRLQVVWKADVIENNPDGSKDYKMYFKDADTVVYPIPVAKNAAGDIVQLNAAMSKQQTPVPLTVITSDEKPITSSLVGTGYTAYAQLSQTTDQNNYVLYDNLISYSITNQLPVFVDPDPNPQPFPPHKPFPPLDGDYLGISFPSPQNNKKTLQPYDYQELEDNHELYIEALFITKNGSTSYILTVDTRTGEITEVDGYTLPSNGYFNFSFEIPTKKDDQGKDVPDLKPNATTIQAVLADPINMAWNTDGKTDPWDIIINIDPTPLDPNPPAPDPDNPDDDPKPADIIVYEDSYKKSYVWQGDPIEPDFIVAVTRGTATRDDDIILTKGVHYTVEWHLNDKVSPAGQRAYFIVKSIDTGGYSFQIGKHVPTDPTPYQHAAGSFQIISSLPKRFEIINGSIYAFEKIEQMNGVTTMTVLSNEERNQELDDPSTSSTAKKIVRLAHTYQGQTIGHLLDQLVNLSKDIVIHDATGNIIYDEDDTSRDIHADLQATITNGMKLVLYENGKAHNPSSGDDLDYIELLLKGDTNNDGIIDVNDINAIYSFIKEEMSLNADDFNSIEYQAGLLTGKSDVLIVDDIGVIYAHIKGEMSGTDDINALYK